MVIGNGDGSDRHFGYLATWTILESTETDPTAFESTIAGVRVGVGVDSMSVHINLTDRDPDDVDALVRQSALFPADDT